MARPFIVLGDSTSHGGEVIEASEVTGTHGKGIARIGDKVQCKWHGLTEIVSGDPTMLIDGQPAAREGDVCECGAELIASQIVTTDACEAVISVDPKAAKAVDPAADVSSPADASPADSPSADSPASDSSPAASSPPVA